MPALPDYLADYPLLQMTARELRMSVDVLRGLLKDQGIDVGPTERVPPEVVYAALQRGLDAGHSWRLEPLERIT